MLGLKRRLFEDFSPGYGFDALAIALLSGVIRRWLFSLRFSLAFCVVGPM